MRRFTHWQRAVLARLDFRAELSRETLLTLLHLDFFASEAYEAFDLFEQEYGIPVGMFRPHDLLSILFEPVRTLNPLRWPGYQMRATDSQSELNYRLRERMQKHGTALLWEEGSVRTFGDFVRAWCGKPSLS